ncbi:hypothetical protein [Dietzia sp. B19]|uniref:DUF6642 family protein n=1 Tax=Dietzia sp. B19 TaxID=1630632 RepID=UPI0015F9B20A|nr:hypothetical protein [Dietzia sp. B19]
MTQRSSSRAPGLVCFEGPWRDRLDSVETIEPALRCLESFEAARVIHKNVATRVELEYYLDKWLGPSGRAMPGYELGMLAFHGSRDTLYVGGDEVTLESLAEIISGRAEGKTLYLGGCEVLASPDETLIDFCRTTGARGLVGYSRPVDMIETAAFEMLLISDLLDAKNFKSVYTRLRRAHPQWTTSLGLRMAHKTWASERLRH